MYLGQVIGSVWGARQADGLQGHKLLKVRPVTLLSRNDQTTSVTPEQCVPSDEVIIAADTLGAGVGEYVLVARGSRVRDVIYDTRRPFKSVVVAIVDSADINLGAVS